MLKMKVIPCVPTLYAAVSIVLLLPCVAATLRGFDDVAQKNQPFQIGVRRRDSEQAPRRHRDRSSVATISRNFERLSPGLDAAWNDPVEEAPREPVLIDEISIPEENINTPAIDEISTPEENINTPEQVVSERADDIPVPEENINTHVGPVRHIYVGLWEAPGAQITIEDVLVPEENEDRVDSALDLNVRSGYSNDRTTYQGWHFFSIDNREAPSIILQEDPSIPIAPEVTGTVNDIPVPVENNNHVEAVRDFNVITGDSSAISITIPIVKDREDSTSSQEFPTVAMDEAWIGWRQCTNTATCSPVYNETLDCSSQNGAPCSDGETCTVSCSMMPSSGMSCYNAAASPGAQCTASDCHNDADCTGEQTCVSTDRTMECGPHVCKDTTNPNLADACDLTAPCSSSGNLDCAKLGTNYKCVALFGDECAVQ